MSDGRFFYYVEQRNFDYKIQNFKKRRASHRRVTVTRLIFMDKINCFQPCHLLHWVGFVHS